jgi:PTH1 family peptidyl-tRNA hydrolase
MLVVVDDLSLPLGAIRLKPSGSDGGHNGLKHIAQTLGGQGYNRLRFGIGNDFPRGTQIDFVLSRFSPEEEKMVNERALVACDAIKAFVLSGIQFAMCNYNNK